MATRLKLKLNNLSVLEALLQELYDETSKNINEIQNEINRLSNSVQLNEEIMDSKVKYAKAMNDYSSNKNKALSTKLDIAKLMAEVFKFNGNISKIVETAALVGDRLDLYSGNDDQIVPILAMGGKGVISVLSNVLPARTVEICQRFFAGDVAGSARLQCELLPLINALFSEVNPIPVKAAMAAMGWCENYVRLPLTPMEEAHWKALEKLMREQGAIE